MKGVIFLLALCTFQIVLADFKAYLNNKHVSSIQKINGLVKQLYKDIEAAFAVGRTYGLNEALEECWDDFTILKNENKHRVSLCEKCYRVAAKSKELEFATRFAEKCYARNVGIVVEEEKERRANTKQCIQRHYDAYVPLREGQQHPAILL